MKVGTVKLAVHARWEKNQSPVIEVGICLTPPFIGLFVTFYKLIILAGVYVQSEQRNDLLEKVTQRDNDR